MTKHGNRSDNKGTKKVVFAENEVSQVVDLSSGTSHDDGKGQCWFSASEIQNLRRQEKEHQDRDDMELESDSLKNNSDSSTRRVQAQRGFVHEILAQQHEHRALGLDDPRGLSQLSKSLSKTSKQLALQQARSLHNSCMAQENVSFKTDAPVSHNVDFITASLATSSSVFYPDRPIMAGPSQEDLIRAIDCALDILESPTPL